jgi:hypothetical protein
MPVRVDQRVNTRSLPVACADGAQQRIGIGGEATVDHQRAVLARHRDTLRRRPGAETGRRDRSW